MVVELKAGKYEATVVPAGAGLAVLRFAGRDLILQHPLDVVPQGFNGQVLVPWPNRVAGGTYIWEGQTLSLEVNEPETRSALHGLAFATPWQVSAQTGSSAALTTQIGPVPGYPFSLSIEATYKLDNDGLEILLTAINTGDRPAPYGASIHPYLTCGIGVDQCELEVPAASVLEVDRNLKPVSLSSVEGTPFDLRASVSLDGQVIDHAFGDLPGGQWSVYLRRLSDGTGVGISSSQPWVQVYTGENQGRAGVAVEPMTCPPNAFNSGQDLQILKPGEESSFCARIFAI